MVPMMLTRPQAAGKMSVSFDEVRACGSNTLLQLLTWLAASPIMLLEVSPFTTAFAMESSATEK